MKKFKKIIAMGCAAVMAMSVMCIGVSAAENEDGIFVNPTQSELEYCADNRIDCRGTESDGTEWEIHYLTKEEITNKELMPASLDMWADNVWVKVNNEAGTNGTVLGDEKSPEFVVSPDSKVHITVGDLDDTMPRVNVSVQRVGTSWYSMKTIGSNSEFTCTIPSNYRGVLHRATTSSNTNASFAYFTMWTD